MTFDAGDLMTLADALEDAIAYRDPDEGFCADCSVVQRASGDSTTHCEDHEADDRRRHRFMDLLVRMRNEHG